MNARPAAPPEGCALPGRARRARGLAASRAAPLHARNGAADRLLHVLVDVLRADVAVVWQLGLRRHRVRDAFRHEILPPPHVRAVAGVVDQCHVAAREEARRALVADGESSMARMAGLSSSRSTTPGPRICSLCDTSTMPSQKSVGFVTVQGTGRARSS